VSADGATNQTAEQGKAPFSGQFVYLGAGALTGRQIGLVPGAEVPLLPVDLPGALRGHAREQVADRQMRDALAGGEDLIEVRPFHGPGNERRWRRVFVVDRARMAEWRAQAGRDGRAVLPDYLALPAAEDVWTLTVAGGMVLARLGVEDGFAAPTDMALHLLAEALRMADSPPRAVFAPNEIPAVIETMFTNHDIPVASSETALRELGLEPPKGLAHGELAFDLRQDPRAARQRLVRNVLPWRWPLLAGLVAVGLWAGAQMIAIHGLEEQTRERRAATLQVVREVFVPAGPILDVRTQVSRALAEARVAATGAGETVSPLDLLGLAADVMSSAGAAPVVVSYSTADGLTASVRVANFAASEDLATALRDAGLAVTVVEARVSEEEGETGVRSDMRISRPEGDE
jgi:general secretion pathway protein L